MKQALEAWQTHVYGSDIHHKAMLVAMTNMGQAIAEAEKQEPYGWVSQHTTKGMYEWQFNKERSGVYPDTAISILPVYTHPQPKREPLTDEEIQLTVNQAVSANTLSWLGYKKDDDGKYTVPVLSPSDFQFARAIEAKLKQKNHVAQETN